MTPPRAEPVVLEVGTRRVFAVSLDWPGWCRPGRDEERALAALAGAAVRYAPVAARAGLAFPDAPGLTVVEHVAGSATTDFGAPGAILEGDREPMGGDEAHRAAALVAAAWRAFDREAEVAPPELRKGPRGGGRDRDRMVAHVLDADREYARKIGVRMRVPEWDQAAIAALRGAVLEALRTGAPEADPERGWPPRYAARRFAWHALDHAWEIQDRTP